MIWAPAAGCALLGRLTDHRMQVQELHRFPNDPVSVRGRLHWDVLRLYHEIKAGLTKALQQGAEVGSIGIDSWAVDLAVISAGASCLAIPTIIVTARTDGVMGQIVAELSESAIFGRTGIQFLPFNTIYQLAALKRDDSPLLREAAHLLMIPDLLRYFLTGEKLHEFTNATTTQLYNPLSGGWDETLLAHIGVPSTLFGTVVQPGSLRGSAAHIRSPRARRPRYPRNRGCGA